MVSSYEKEGTDYLNVDPSALSFMLINAVKEQQKIIKTQEAEIEELKAQNIELKSTDSEMKAEIENIKAKLGINNDIVKNK